MLARAMPDQAAERRDLLDAPKQPGQLGVIAQMAIADDVQCAARDKCHATGKRIT